MYRVCKRVKRKKGLVQSYVKADPLYVISVEKRNSLETTSLS